MRIQSESKEDRILKLERIISDLQHNEGFDLLVKDKQATVDLCNNAWHLIDLDDKNKLLELKYAKLGAEAIINSLDYYKQELARLKEEDEQQQGYMDD